MEAAKEGEGAMERWTAGDGMGMARSEDDIDDSWHAVMTTMGYSTAGRKG